MGDGNDPTARVFSHRVGEGDTEERSAVFDALREGLAIAVTGGGNLPFDFVGGWLGYFGYELKALTEIAETSR